MISIYSWSLKVFRKELWQRSFRLHLLQDLERQVSVGEMKKLSENHRHKHVLLEDAR